MKALLFDMDGTLAHTERLHIQALQQIAWAHGKQVSTQALAAAAGRTTVAVVAELFPELDGARHLALAAEKESLFRQLATDLTPVAGLVTLLERARRRDLRIGLVTNAPLANVTHVLKTLMIGAYFDTVVTADYLPRSKPDPLPYSVALKELHVAPSAALAFEDSVPGIRSATGAGIRTIGVTSNIDAAVLRAAGASDIIADFAGYALPTEIS